MNLRTATAFLTVLLAASGCVVQGGKNPKPPPTNAQPGDVNFTWALGGGTCAQNPDVHTIRITIPGQALENDGSYACDPNGIMGIRLHDFRPGSYTFTLQGLDVVDAVRFARSGSFVVNGDVAVHVDLDPQDAIVDLYWNLPGNEEFPNDPTCHQAGIPYMAVMIDGQLVPYYENGQLVTVQVGNERRPVVPCQVGQSAGGLRINLPTAGVHTIELYGVDGEGYAYYRHVSTLSAFAGQVAHAEYDLSWAVGAAFVDWDLYNVVKQTCAQAGVTEVAVQFQDAEGYFLYGDDYDTGDRIACDEYGAIFSFIPDGQYWIYTAGFSSGGTLRYGSDIDNPPRITVQAGLFTRRASSNAVLMEMDRL